MKKSHRMRVWVLAWTPEEAEEMAGEPGVAPFNPVTLETPNEFKVKCTCHPLGWHFGDTLAVFETKDEAEAYQKEFFSYPNGNKSWGIYPATLEVRGK